MIKKAFDAINDFNTKLDNKIAEISVKQSQVVFVFEDSGFLTINDFNLLRDCMDPCKVSDIGCFNNMIYIGFRDIDHDMIARCEELNKHIYNLFQVIDVLKKVLCTCPLLEYVVSPHYLKIYLDLNNIQLSNLIFLLESWNQDPFLELSAERPYLLYINESDINE